MANEQNLLPHGRDLSNGEAARIGSIGGKASGKAKKEKKTFQELAQMMLSMSAPEIIKEKVRQLFPDITDADMTAKMAMLYAQYGKALKGDSKAFEVVRDTSGEKPIEKTELTGNISVNVIDYSKAVSGD